MAQMATQHRFSGEWLTAFGEMTHLHHINHHILIALHIIGVPVS